MFSGGDTTRGVNRRRASLGLEAQGTIYVAQWAVTGSTLNLLGSGNSH